MSNVFEELSKQKKGFQERIIRLETSLEHKLEIQQKAKEQAIDMFGTDDPKALASIVEKGKSKNIQIERELKTSNEIVDKVLSLLESGEEVPASLVSQLNQLIEQPSTTAVDNKETEESSRQVNTDDALSSTSSSQSDTNTLSPVQNIPVEQNVNDDDMANLDKALASMSPADEGVNHPLNDLVRNASTDNNEVSTGILDTKANLSSGIFESEQGVKDQESMFAGDEDLSLDDLGSDIDLSQIGTLESIAAQMPEEPLPTAPVKPTVAPSNFSF